MNCTNCKDEGWVCENHPDKAWDSGDGCCGGAGMPCKECNDSDYYNPPRNPPGMEILYDRDKGILN